MSRIALIAMMAALGCGGAARRPPESPESIVRAQEPAARLVQGMTGEEIGFEALVSQMRRSRVVYVGERHDRPEDHAVQYALLRRLHAEDGSLAIGMEMFQVPFQQPLDAWSAGEIDETVLRDATEYDQRWGYDYSMYRPILEYARSHGLEVVALNAPREVVFAVAKHGVDSLPAEVASTLPDLDLQDPNHRALFDAEFDTTQHDVGDGIEGYYQAQVVWDETMGNRVAETLRRPDGPSRMLVFAGRVHVKQGVGVPERGARRGAEPFLVVIPVSEKELKAELKSSPGARSADVFWVLPD